MDPSTLSRHLTGEVLEFTWDEWAQMGVLAATRARSTWAQDPEALILFTLEIARADPRLFDELMDWILTNEELLSVRRLRVLCIDDADRALTAAAIGWLARQRPRARLRTQSEQAVPTALESLFRQEGPVGRPDMDFAAAGLLRPELPPSHNSQPPDLMAPIALALRLRQILGVGIRAEVMRILLCIDAPWAGARALARSAGYSRRNVHDALTGLTNARVIAQHTVGGEQRYTANRPGWATLLDRAPEELPSHRDWPQLLGALRVILRFLSEPGLDGLSDYMRSSRTRDLLERVRPELAFAGVPVSVSPGPDAAWGNLEDVIESTLGMLRRD
jgi:hypothetical protein